MDVNKKYHDAKKKDPDIKVGDMVEETKSPVFEVQPMWTGPWDVTKVLREGIKYEIKCGEVTFERDAASLLKDLGTFELIGCMDEEELKEEDKLQSCPS